MKHPISAAVVRLTQSLTVIAVLSMANTLSADGDGKQVVVEGRGGGKQVVVEAAAATDGKQVVVEGNAGGKQVVVEGNAGGKQVVVKDVAAGTVAGRVYDDANADGKKGSDESYLSAISVKLIDANDELAAATKSNEEGIYVFQNIDSGQYYLEFDFGDNKKVQSQDFAVVGIRSSVIVEPVPYFKGFDFNLKQPIKIHRVVTSSEISRLPKGTGLSTPPKGAESPASPFRP